MGYRFANSRGLPRSCTVGSMGSLLLWWNSHCTALELPDRKYHQAKLAACMSIEEGARPMVGGSTSAINFKEIPHPISESERIAEKDVLAQIESFYANTKGTPRENYDILWEQTPIVKNVSLEEVKGGDVSGWWVTPNKAKKGRAVLFLHGGGYVVGSAKAYRGFVSQIAARASVRCFILEYPLAPEAPFPAAYENGVKTLHWLTTQGVKQISVVGDSAGGGFALALLGAKTNAAPKIASLVVFSPWTDMTLSGNSMNSSDTFDPLNQSDAFVGLVKTVLKGADARDPRASPLFAIPDDLPPLFLQVGSNEILLDDARRYAAAATRRGGEVRIDIYEGLHHVFQSQVVGLDSARRALDDAATFIKKHWF